MKAGESNLENTENRGKPCSQNKPPTASITPWTLPSDYTSAWYPTPNALALRHWLTPLDLDTGCPCSYHFHSCPWKLYAAVI